MNAPSWSLPRVSVVVPTYNARALLAETLAAILAQTFADFELIVVDDGSTDDTAGYLATITDARLRVIRQANAGVGAARNRGIDAARGEFVAFCDHDDLWTADKLATQVAFMDAHPACVACGVPWSYSTDPATPVYTHAGPTPFVERPLDVLSHGGLFLITSALMVRRSAINGLRYFIEPHCFEDTPLQIRLLALGPFGIAGDRVRMTYRWHEANYSSSADYFANGVALVRRLQAEGYFSDVAGQRDLEAFVCHLARTATMKLLKAGRRGDAWRLYRRELRRQTAVGAWKFVLGFPVLALIPSPVYSREMVRVRAGGQ